MFYRLSYLQTMQTMQATASFRCGPLKIGAPHRLNTHSHSAAHEHHTTHRDSYGIGETKGNVPRGKAAVIVLDGRLQNSDTVLSSGSG